VPGGGSEWRQLEVCGGGGARAAWGDAAPMMCGTGVRGGGQGARRSAMRVAGLFCLSKLHELLEQTRFAICAIHCTR
jgi:hypothetical protein